MASVKAFQEAFGSAKPILGVVHIHALPGAPRYAGSLEEVVAAAIRDAETLAEGGVHALILENFHDYPFYPETTEPETVSAMTLVAKAVRERVDLPLGVQVLRNSWKSSLAIAYVIGAKFIRLNILTDAMVADQGLIQGAAHLALRYRKSLGATSVGIFADLYSKHAAPLARRPVGVVARDMVERGLADALIVSGEESSDPPSEEQLQQVKDAVRDVPVIIGSGMTDRTAALLRIADGTIFGYGAHRDLDFNAPVDLDLVRRFVEAAGQALRPAGLQEGAARRNL